MIFVHGASFSYNGLVTQLLLQTKIIAPPLRSHLVDRPRLIRRLNSSLTSRFTLVAAPAGCGKTTLIGQWIEKIDGHAAWYSIDNGDNDVNRFLAYFVSAAASLDPSIGRLSTSLIHGPQPPSYESVLTALINDMAGLQNSGPENGKFVIVLDDYQLIETQAIHDCIAFFIERMPDNTHLVIASRTIPPIPLARLRAQGQLIELNAEDLRFNLEEAASLMRHAGDPNLTTDEAQLFTDRTEGWAAGLQMAAIALRGLSYKKDAHSISRFVQDFSGSNRYILDYLVEEVIQGQPAEVRGFLIRTSILEQMTASLCDAVLDIQGINPSDVPAGTTASPKPSLGQGMLELLESSNLFLIALDEERIWYRYHHLFRDLLRQRLSQFFPDEVPILHARAASWFERKGLLPDAIEHALAARDYRSAARLIERVADSTLMSSEVTTFLHWREELPEDIARDYPLLCLYSAIAMLLAGRPLGTIEQQLSIALHSAEDGQVVGEIGVLRAILAALQGDTRQGIEISNEAIKRLPDDRLFLRSIALENLGLAHMASGDVRSTVNTLKETVRTGRETGNIMVGAVALCQLADQRKLQGRLNEAYSLYRQALDLSTSPTGRKLPIAGMAYISLGSLYHQWNRYDEALDFLRDGIELSLNWGAIGALDGYLVLARIKQAQSDAIGFAEALENARQVAAQFDASELDDIAVEAHIARLSLVQGDFQTAIDWVENRFLDLTSIGIETGRAEASYHLKEFEHITLARILIAQGKSAEALSVLVRLEHDAEHLERFGSEIEILTLQALAYKEIGDRQQALSALKRALVQAEPEGYVRVFADEAPSIIDLLQQIAPDDVSPDYISALLSAIKEDQQQSFADTVVAPADLLSPREIEVLRLVGIGCANSEIAEELVISLNTAKWHVHNICKKLEARNRTEAIAKARDRGILF